MPGSCQAAIANGLSCRLKNFHCSILYQNLAGSLTSVGHWLSGLEQISLYDDNEKQNSTGYLISCNAASFSQLVGSFWSIQDQPACRHSLPTEFKKNCYKLMNNIFIHDVHQLPDIVHIKKWTIPGNVQSFPGNSSLPLIPTLNSSLTFIKAMSTCVHSSSVGTW